MTLTLWGNGTTRTFRPIWLLHELDVEFDLRAFGPRTGETKTDAYTALNPKQKIPFMDDEGFGLSESVAICNYLLNRYGKPDQVYMPSTAQEIARHDEWCHFIQSELDETSLYVIRRHQDLGEIYGASPEVVEAAKAYVFRQLNAIEKLAPNLHSYLIGNRLSVPDLLLVSCLDWMYFYKMEVPEFFRGYRKTLRSRPAYRKAFEINYGFPVPE